MQHSVRYGPLQINFASPKNISWRFMTAVPTPVFVVAPQAQKIADPLRLWRNHENCSGDESRFARLNRRCPPPPQGFALSGASFSVSPLRVPSPAAGTKRRVAATRRLTKFQGRVKVLNSGIYLDGKFYLKQNSEVPLHL